MYDADYSSVGASITQKAAFYDHVLESLKGLLAVENGEKHDWVSALSSVSSVLFNAYADFPSHFGNARRVNWAGRSDDPLHLVVGPYQGRPGCVRIPLRNKRKGVCAESFLSQRIVTVQDVHQVPGHIACDASTECEIVVPLKYSLLDASAPSGKRSIPLGVLDIDCQKAASWSSEDEEGLRKIVDWLMQEDGVVDWKGAFRSLNSAA